MGTLVCVPYPRLRVELSLVVSSTEFKSQVHHFTGPTMFFDTVLFRVQGEAPNPPSGIRATGFLNILYSHSDSRMSP
jgi:hypothetical protein